uniref:Uncharacterized protein n=1 Tax=uncultured marine microorganism HF4000_APKG7H23 TaxID=455551 RepID=B3T9T7_9ZZZZ|nr:hypothetical protein ALOHA_HF4000APKG7H23ctg3g11 [uncultured marine microorganism HF4000_APKG7H23]
MGAHPPNPLRRGCCPLGTPASCLMWNEDSLFDMAKSRLSGAQQPNSAGQVNLPGVQGGAHDGPLYFHGS